MFFIFYFSNFLAFQTHPKTINKIISKAVQKIKAWEKCVIVS